MASKLAFFVMISIVTMVMAVQRANAQLGFIGQILGITNITGAVSCSLTVNANAPPFTNARVQLQCGPGNVLASTSTNNMGTFSMVVTRFTVLLTDLLNGNCMVVVATPLASCNASLPSNGGLLASALQPIGSIANGIVNILNPSGFQFTPGL